MATTTTNFGWDIPQSTDLVKDGATAIAALGQDIDTSMVDLKGGTTGQILSKTSNTDMDFTWVTPNPGDITGVTAGTGLTGGGTSGSVTLDFDVANYGGGQKAAGKNAAINGGQDIWQRGTSFTTNAAYTYCSDRWYYSRSAGNTTVSQQTDAPTGFNYSVRLARNSGDTNTSSFTFHTALETSDSLPFAGQTVTFSFYAKCGANYTAGAIATYINTGTGTNQAATGQNAGTWTGFTSPLNGSTFTPTTTWTRYTFTATIGSTATQIGMGFLTNSFSGTAGANDWVQLTGLQFELGSTATPFSRAGGTIQGELAACQRYYQRFGTNSIPAICATQSATSAYCYMPTRVTMRTTPTAIEYSNLRLVNYGTAAYTVTSFTLSSSESGPDTVVFTADGATGMTANRPIFIYNTGSSGYFGFTAEL